MAEENKPEQPGGAQGGESKPIANKPVAKKPAVMETTSWESELTKQLQRHFGEQITEFSTYVGQDFLVARPEAVVPILEFLKLEADFDYLVDVTAVDYPKRAERFDLIYVVYSFARNQRIRVKTRIKEDHKPETAVGVHLTADWLEREVFDMFGIEFANHPNMKRILMPDGWEGHPLRKDKGILDMDNRWVKDNLGIDSGQ
jgi:NADH-quinone oxidoreductase subunit C